MSDIDREWKPKGRRPQSTMAQALADTLDNVFMLNSDVDTLSNKIHQKKQTITIQNWELEALQARIREAEERLKRQESMAATSTVKPQNSSNRSQPNNTPYEQDETASSPISDSFHSEGGLTDTSTAPSTTSNEDLSKTEDAEEIDGQTIREVTLPLRKGKEPERYNNR